MGATTEVLVEILAFLPPNHPLRPLALEGSGQLLWLKPEDGRQILRRLPAGRYKVEYWGKDCASPWASKSPRDPPSFWAPPTRPPWWPLSSHRIDPTSPPKIDKDAASV